MLRLSGLDWFCLVMTIIGGINWGLIGFFNYDLIDSLFAGTLARVIYGIVGLCALYMAFVSPRLSKKTKVGERVGTFTQEKIHAAK